MHFPARPSSSPSSRPLRLVLLAVGAFVASGCAGVVSRTTDGLTRGLLEHDDLATVREGAPAYLLAIDGLIAAAPDDEDRLAAGASLYTAYAAIFVSDAPRQRRLAARALGYAERAVCAAEEKLCGLRTAPLERAQALVAEFGEDPEDAAILFTLAEAWLGWIKANAADFVAIAELPRPQALLERVLALDERHAQAHLYMGVLETLRPPALGGRPEEGRRHFERAIELTGGRDLGAKVQFAESYARLVFDRELHDRLLNEVLASPEAAPRLTLQNVIAKQRARELLAGADDYF